MGSWLAKQFPTIDGTNEVLVFEESGFSVGFDPSDPHELFHAIPAGQPKHADLSNLPCASKGWQKIFDQWKAKGFIS